MKKNLLIIFIALIALATGYFFLTKKELPFTKETSIYKAVPLDAPMFIEFKSLKTIPVKNAIFKNFTNAGILEKLITKINHLDTLISGSKEITDNLRNQRFLIALNLEGNQTIVPSFILEVNNKNKRRGIETLLNQLYPNSKYQQSKRTYNSRKITSISNSTDAIHYSFTNGLLLISPNVSLVEKAIRQIDSESILNNPLFGQANKTASIQSESSVYINHSFFHIFAGKWISDSQKTKTNEFGKEINFTYNNKIQSVKNYASWTELDLTITDTEIKLNGVSIANNSLAQFLNIFHGQEAIKFRSDKILPNTTSLFFSYSFSEKTLFLSKLEENFTHSPEYYEREQQLKTISSATPGDVKQIFETILDNEIAFAFTGIDQNSLKTDKLFIVSIKSQSNAIEQLLKWLGQYAVKKGTKLDQLTLEYKVDNESKFKIYTFPYPSFPGIWLGTPFSTINAKYFTFWDNNIIFSGSQSSLKNYLHQMVLGATLSKNMDYLKFKENSDDRANINFYLDINKSFPLNSEYLTKSSAKYLKSKKDILQKFGAFNWQVINTKEIYFNNLYLNFSEELKEDAKTVWQSSIGRGINFKPQLMLNHNDLNNKEIIVQDLDNKLHQITKDGRVRWSIQIANKIMGEIHQIDFLKNKKYQYLFNTKNKLYLLDRNGNNVSPFPINLRSPATNGVSVFDYDNNRKYRYFIAGEDKKIYAYDAAGKVISGWKFGKTDHEVTTPVQHFRISNKDYIVFKDKTKIYIQNRQGAQRVKVAVKFENSNNPLILNTTGTPKIIATATDGTVYFLYFNGKYVKKKSSKASAEHFFMADDLNNNSIVDFIFIDKNELTVSDENGKNLFSKKFNNSLTNGANIYTFSKNNKKIGVVNQQENKIYLFNPDGTLHNGFPLIGNSEFTIGKISSGAPNLNLIVGSQDGKIYNYELN